MSHNCIPSVGYVSNTPVENLLRPPAGFAPGARKPKLTYVPITSLSYCHTHGNTQDAGEWVDESGDECCESWFDQDDPARCVICDVFAKVPAT